jgi:hypothetical protein
VSLGVAVIPLGVVGPDGEQAVLLLRPKPADASDGAFRGRLLADARCLRSLCLYCALEGDLQE